MKESIPRGLSTIPKQSDSAAKVERLWQIGWAFQIGRQPASALVVAGQSSIEHDASTDQSEDDRREQQQRAPILGRMAQNTDEMAAIVNRR
jgi:hypothetical protein